MAWALIPDWVKRTVAVLIAVILLVLGFWLWLTAHDAAVASEARAGYVTQAVLDASEAKRLKAEADAKFADGMKDFAQKQADSAQVSLKSKQDTLDARIKADTATDISRWTQRDLDRLR